MKELKGKKQVEYVSSANTLGIEEIKKFNQFDEEFLKIVPTYKIDNLFSIVTEEPFYFKTKIMCDISNGTYSLIINMLIKKVISTKEFYEATVTLKDLNYPLKIDMSAYKYIVNLSSDNWIKKTVRILNEYNK